MRDAEDAIASSDCHRRAVQLTRGRRRPCLVGICAAAVRSRRRSAARKRQPGGNAARSGGWPVDRCAARASAPSTCGSSRAAPACTGCRGRCEHLRAWRRSRRCDPAYITATRSAHLGDDAEIVRHERSAPMPNSRCSDSRRSRYLRLHRHVECRGRLVGDQERRMAGERDRAGYALAHAAAQLRADSRADAASRVRNAHAPEASTTVGAQRHRPAAR